MRSKHYKDVHIEDMLCGYDKDRVAFLKIGTYERIDGCNCLMENNLQMT